MLTLVYAPLVACFLGAHAGNSVLVRGDSAAVIQWFTTNRDFLIGQAGARVMRREGSRLVVAKDGFYVELRETAKRWTIDWYTATGPHYAEVQPQTQATIHAATYRTQLFAGPRKLRSWTTDITIQPHMNGWTWIRFAVDASLNGPGEIRLQGEIDAAVERITSAVQGAFH